MLHMLDKWYIAGMTRFHRFKTEDRGDVNIVSIVVLCGIVIFLAIIFRDALKDVIDKTLDEVATNAQNVAGETPAPK